MLAANDVYATAAEKLAPERVPVVSFPYPLLPRYFELHDRGRYRDAFRLKPSDILITVPSRIIERKGIKEAVIAISKLPDNFFLCLPCAINPLDHEYWHGIETSKEFKKAQKRILIPKKAMLPEEMPYLYAASDIILMPSYYEGAPVATVEAMAAKKPFIGANSQGINGFIRHMENGLLVPKKSTDEIVGAVMTLVSDESLQHILIAQALEDVRNISWEFQLPKLLEVYQQCVQKDSLV
ncbi:hypothetical protein BH23PAT2_BH23PAT2_03000 [soil metagenome]